MHPRLADFLTWLFTHTQAPQRVRRRRRSQSQTQTE